MQRLYWKRTVLAEMKTNSALPIISLPSETLKPFQPVRAQGVFVHDREIYLSAKYHKETLGVEVITPMRLADDSIILVDRGFAPEGQKRITTQGVITITGIMRDSEHPAWYMPQNRPEQNFWLWRDIPAIAKATGARPIWVQMTESISELPIAQPPEFQLRNDHLEYAITWYALALLVPVMYYFYLRRK